MTVSDRTHYEVIDAETGASKAELKAAYAAALEAAQASADSDEVVAVRRAWQVLSDPVQRQRYDETLGLTGRAGGFVATPDVEIVDVDSEVVAAEIVEGEHDHDGEPVVRTDRPSGIGDVPDFLEQPTLGRRLVASLIDVVLMVGIFAATFAIVIAVFSSDGARFAGIIVAFELWTLVLFLIPTARTGQTLGKRRTYIMTVDRATGNLPSVGQVILRYIVPMVAVPALGQLGPFLALFFGLSYAMGRDQLSLADRLGKTIVVVARYEPTRHGAA